jgi:peptidyl-prolyl cis-trans isomerase B (cyclophilin B)
MPQPGYPQQYVPGMNPTNPFAIASLILSILGISIGGVICGHVALGQINRSNGYEQGRGIALAGLIIGYIGLGIGLIIAVIGLIIPLLVLSTTPTH